MESAIELSPEKIHIKRFIEEVIKVYKLHELEKENGFVETPLCESESSNLKLL